MNDVATVRSCSFAAGASCMRAITSFSPGSSAMFRHPLITRRRHVLANTDQRRARSGELPGRFDALRLSLTPLAGFPIEAFGAGGRGFRGADGGKDGAQERDCQGGAEEGASRALTAVFVPRIMCCHDFARTYTPPK